MVMQPSACRLLRRSLQQEARGEYFADSHTDPSFTSGHCIRFLGLGVNSAELGLRGLTSNPDHPPIYLRDSAQTGTWLLVQNILRISQCLWEPQMFAKYTYSNHRQRSLLVMVSGKIIPIFLYVVCFWNLITHTLLSNFWKLPANFRVLRTYVVLQILILTI